MWSVGAIFYEMAHKRPLFYGDSEIGQIFKIFRMLGTPTEETWPGVTQLKEFSKNFPVFKKRPLAEILTGVEPDGVKLVEMMLSPNPKERPSAAECLESPWLTKVAIE